ncbi:glycosyltransferase [Xanthomonas campestris pv. raphani]|uniref:glycosyltransferase n=1 Tax=Xanthomonas campestris TaxID=339 RepID=UPI002B221C0A|nr:glycosyltransferase [Xanthomonas campestris]MEA9884256.1 glycosyltransferase [Xanthomonas campestris pv. raphani]MEB2181599.1 glycosyltransferase [Xanthomonas campestris pv. campestris]
MPSPFLATAAAPRVTVAVPAYKSTFLETALRSVLAQDLHDLELLICDDCPNDAVAEVVAPFLASEHGARIRYLRNPQQLLEVGNFGRCIAQARGTYLKFLCDDDVLLPGCLTAMADVLDRHPDVALVSSRRQLIDEHGTQLPDSGATAMPFDGDVCVHGQELVSFLAERTLNFIGEPSTVMFRTAQMRPHAHAPFSLQGRRIQWLGDLTMHVNLLREGHLAMLQTPLSCFRISAGQVSNASRLNPDIGRDGFTAFRAAIGELGWQRSVGNHQVGVRPLENAQSFVAFDLGVRVDRMLRNLPPAPPSSGEILRNWLGQRVPDDTQLRLIEARLQTGGGGPLIGVVILDRHGEAAAIEATLQSLVAQVRQYPLVQVQIISPLAEITPQAAPFPIHVHRHEGVLAQLEAINALAATWATDWLLSVKAGATFTASGLLVVAQDLLGDDSLRAVYADEMIRAEDGELSALLRPDFNLDLLLSMPASMVRHWLYKRDTFVQAGGLDPALTEAAELDLLLRLIDADGLSGLGHVHEPLLVIPTSRVCSHPAERQALLRHLHHRGYAQAKVDSHLPGCYRIDYGHSHTPGVSIIVPTKNQLGMLQRCVETLLEKTTYANYELLIVDNGSTDTDACQWLDGIEAMDNPQLRVLRYPQPFNYAAMNNLAAQHARGEYLVLLNNDTAILRDNWLHALLNHAQRPEVGVVGAKLLYPDGTVQHAGVLLGLRGPAEHPFNGQTLDAPGYMYRLQVDQDYSAVTGACLMVRASLYAEVGGLDEDAFKISYNDVDLCLKIRQAGYLVVWTPHALLLHEGSVSQTRVDTATQSAKLHRFEAEQEAMYRKWLSWIAHDPAYNRNLSLHGTAFQVEDDNRLTWRPLSWRPLPTVLAMSADQDGCGNYRIIQPVRAMQAAGLADAIWSMRYLSPVEMQRLQPDTLVLQRQMFEHNLEPQQRGTRFSSCFKVAELDDYLPNVPRKSLHRDVIPNDIMRSMRKSLAMVDRFVVSTPALAEALHGMHRDIRVVENRLPLPWWQDRQGLRRQGRRPRVGWGGGGGHRGDLEMIEDVVKALAGEVEWVFFGMCPESLRPYVHEFHPGVPIDRYPATLAGLNLDLALAPLEDNLFNQCKSNLRLLEYGACGFPVVCSDVRPYQGPLPVIRVRQRYRDWVEAIRMHTHDLDAAAASGDALRAAVHREWMLDQDHAAGWLGQWLPD